MIVTATLPQAMRMASLTGVEHKIHNDIDDQANSCDNQHDLGVFHEFLIDNSVCSFVNQKDGDAPDDEEVAKCSNNFHPMEAKRVFFVWSLVRTIKKNVADDEANQIGDEMGGIADDRYGVGQDAAENLSSDKDYAQNNHNDELTVVFGVVVLLGNLVQVKCRSTWHIFEMSVMSRETSLNSMTEILQAPRTILQ